MGSSKASKMLRKAGLAHNHIAEGAGDEALDIERKTYTRDGDLEEGFASSIVPTLEEKALIEQQPSLTPVPETEPGTATAPGPEAEEAAEKTSQSDKSTPGPPEESPPQQRTGNGSLFGHPADASGTEKTDDQPPHARSGVDDASDEEQKAPVARSILRRHLAAKLGSKNWTLPTAQPKVDVDAFEDPICDQFWKDVWVASATHNVGWFHCVCPILIAFEQTEIYRKVFHAIPDDLVTTWKQYKEFVVHHERMNKPVSSRTATTWPLLTAS